MFLTSMLKYRYHKHHHVVLALIIGIILGHLVTTFVQNTSIHNPLCQMRSNNSGATLQRDSTTTSLVTIPASMQKARSEISSKAHHTSEIPLRPTSHVGVAKRPLVEPFALHPYLAGVSYATIDAGKNIDLHQHTSMSEFFFVVQGSGWVQLGGDRVDNPSRHQPLQQGSFVFVGPHWNHSFGASSNEPLTLLFFGVTDD